MSETRLAVDACLALTWAPAGDDAAPARGNLLLLRAVNALESALPDTDSDRLHERLETKLDLALHWLGLVLYGQAPIATMRNLRLDATGLAWQEVNPAPAGSRLRLSLYPSARLSAPLLLMAQVSALEHDWVRVEFLDFDEDIQEQWTQWLFRLHRRGIQAARGGLSA